MTKHVVFLVIPAILLIFSACKEEKPVKAPCQNGFLDAGETGIDCGGNCPPCIPVDIPLLYVECNGDQVNISAKSLTYSNGSWSLQISNDTLSIQIALGKLGYDRHLPIDRWRFVCCKKCTVLHELLQRRLCHQRTQYNKPQNEWIFSSRLLAHRI